MDKWFNIASAIFALAAAALWFKASSISTPRKFTGITFDDTGLEGDLPKLFQGVAEQSKWNKWAAGVAGVAAALQAVALFLARAQ